MGIWVDALVVICMAGFIIIGYKKGLIKVALSFVAIILSFVIAFTLYRPVATAIINNTELDNNINNHIYEKIKDVDFKNITEKDKENNKILKFSEKYVNSAIEQSKDNIAEDVSENLTRTIIEGISFLGLLIITRIALIALNLLSSFIAEFPIIKQFNKSGGVLYGIIEGFFIINTIFAIIYLINTTTPNTKLERAISDSKIGSLVYENNVIINVIF